ncbi:MAG: cobalamin-binding protein [Arenicellales bacterium]
MKIVSLNCSNTEIVCALGRAGELVGVDDHSDFPPAVVARLPRVGPDLTPDMERIKALEPDLVLASLTVPGHEKVIANLESAGLQYLAPEPTRLEDIYRDIEVIARALGATDRAARVIDAMRSSVSKNRGSSTDPKPTILVQWWPKPVISPGRLSWVNDLIEGVGAVNPLGEEAVKSRPLEDSEVRDMDPDVIVMSWCGVDPRKYRADVICNKPEWAGLRAVREQRVYAVPEAYLGRPSPRLTSGCRALRSIVDVVSRESTADRQRQSDPSP